MCPSQTGSYEWTETDEPPAARSCLAYEEVCSGKNHSSHLFKSGLCYLNTTGFTFIMLLYDSTESDVDGLSSYTQGTEPEPFYSRASEDRERLDDQSGGGPEEMTTQNWYK